MMDHVRKLIYENLRFNYTRLTHIILGRDYYNMGCDQYSCDDEIAKDIVHVFKTLKQQVKFYRYMCILFIVIIILLIIFK